MWGAVEAGVASAAGAQVRLLRAAVDREGGGSGWAWRARRAGADPDRWRPLGPWQLREQEGPKSWRGPIPCAFLTLGRGWCPWCGPSADGQLGPAGLGPMQLLGVRRVFSCMAILVGAVVPHVVRWLTEAPQHDDTVTGRPTKPGGTSTPPPPPTVGTPGEKRSRFPFSFSIRYSNTLEKIQVDQSF